MKSKSVLSVALACSVICSAYCTNSQKVKYSYVDGKENQDSKFAELVLSAIRKNPDGFKALETPQKDTKGRKKTVDMCLEEKMQSNKKVYTLDELLAKVDEFTVKSGNNVYELVFYGTGEYTHKVRDILGGRDRWDYHGALAPDICIKKDVLNNFVDTESTAETESERALIRLTKQKNTLETKLDEVKKENEVLRNEVEHLKRNYEIELQSERKQRITVEEALNKVHEENEVLKNAVEVYEKRDSAMVQQIEQLRQACDVYAKKESETLQQIEQLKKACDVYAKNQESLMAYFHAYCQQYGYPEGWSQGQ